MGRDRDRQIVQIMFGRDRVEFDGVEWSPRQDEAVQTRIRSCKRLQRNAVSFQGTNGLGCDVRGGTELQAWDHVEEVEDDIENMAFLGHGDCWVCAIF